MGFGVSASYAVVAFAVIATFGILFGAVGGVVETISDSGQEGSQIDRLSDTQITIEDVTYSDGYLSLRLKNTGTITLTPQNTDILVDGEYYPAEGGPYTVEGIADTTIWSPTEVFRLALSVNKSQRVKIVTDNGVAKTAVIAPFRQSPTAAFANNSALRSATDGEPIIDYPETVEALGPVSSDFTTNGALEAPAVTESGDVTITTPIEGTTTLATDAKANFSRLGVGYWDNSSPSIFYVTGTGDRIQQVTPAGTTSTVANVSAQGVAGPGDIDADGNPELIFGGNGPDGVSDSVVFVDEDGDIIGTGVEYGNSSGIGLGEPADFNQDGTERIPIVDGNNDIILVGNGTTTRLTTTQPAAIAPIATANVDGDARSEIVFVGLDKTLKYVDNVAGNLSVVSLRDSQGEAVDADVATGVA